MILITRPQPDASQWAQELERRGHRCAVHPLTIILPIPGATSAIHSALTAHHQPVIITSTQILHLGLLSAVHASQPIYCLSAATAEKLHALGFTHITHAEGGVQNLAALIRRHSVPFALYLRAEHISADLRSLLPDTHLTEIICYKAAAVGALTPALLTHIRQGDICAVTFLSRRTAEIYAHLAEQASIAGQSAIMDCFCLSANIAEAAACLPWKRMIISSEPSSASLSEAIDNTIPAD